MPSWIQCLKKGQLEACLEEIGGLKTTKDFNQMRNTLQRLESENKEEYVEIVLIKWRKIEVQNQPHSPEVENPKVTLPPRTQVTDPTGKSVNPLLTTGEVLKEVNHEQFYDVHNSMQVSARNNAASIIDTARKWNIKFEDKQEPKDVLLFLERIEESSAVYGIPLDRLAACMPELLKGNALAWFRNNRELWEKWEYFKLSFRDFFLPSRLIEIWTDEVTDYVKDFAIELQTKRRWIPGMSKEKQLKRIYESLRPEYKLYIRSGFSIFQELVALAEEFEYIKSQERQYNKKSVSVINETTTTKQGHLTTESKRTRIKPVRRNPFRYPVSRAIQKLLNKILLHLQ